MVADSPYFSRKQWITFFVLFFAANCMQLFCNGVYLDDWVVIFHSNQENTQFFHELGTFGFWNMYVYNFLYTFKNGIFLNRLAVFLCYLIASLFFERSLRAAKDISTNERFFLTLIFSLYPVDYGRATLNQLHYVANYASYFVGLFCLVKFELERKFLYRVLALAFIFFSFATNSLLTFQAATVLYLIYLKKDRPLRVIIKEMLGYWDLVVIVVLFWVLKQKYYTPYGFYSMVAYNAVTTGGLLQAPQNWIHDFGTTFQDTIFTYSLGRMTWEKTFYATLISFFLFSGFKIKQRSGKFALGAAIFGAALFCIATFPYDVVQKHPGYNDFLASGFQLLVPAGAALIIFAAFSYLYTVLTKYSTIRFRIGKKELDEGNVVSLLLGFLIISFTAANCDFFYDINLDSLKQKALMIKMRELPELKETHTFAMEDQSRKLNVFGRVIFEWEYAGLYRQYLGKDDAFFFWSENCELNYKGNWLVTKEYEQFRERFNIKNYVPAEPTVRLVYSAFPGLRDHFWSLFWQDHFDQEAFERNAKEYIKIKVKPFDDPACR